jgi:inner membrane protein
MASLGHIAVGMAASRVDIARAPSRWRSMLFWSALSMLPDADVIGLNLGVAYSAPWGHRGATHSFLFALALGTAVGLIAPRFRAPALGTGLLASLVLASHAVLDTLTDGGLGCALFWPFDLTRYFAPWQPIPVSPIGRSYFSEYGLIVAATEVVFFAPLFLFAMWPSFRKRVSALVVSGLAILWLIGAWLVGSTDPFRERVVGAVLREHTELADGFSEAEFRQVKKGESENAVRQRLGPGLDESWVFGPGDRPAFEIAAAQLQPACITVQFSGETVSAAYVPELCGALGIVAGTPKSEVARILGTPTDVCVGYSRGAGHRFQRLRAICFLNGSVSEVFRRWIRAPG